MEGNPDEKDASFVVEKRGEIFLLSFTFNGSVSAKKKDVIDKDEDVPKFIEKKIKSA